MERLSGRFDAIVLVDDGSGAEYAPVFERARAVSGVHFLRHAANLGKGAALKTAIDYVLRNFPGLGIVTADADGQHDPEDIESVARGLLDRPDTLVLGARTFDKKGVPFRSRFGNVLTRGIMHALAGQEITDTQTGLRGIPAALLPRLLDIQATGYDFELEMLLAAHRLEVPVSEQPIRTIYEPGNRSSHFNPLIDSMKIYFVLLRFGSVSLMTALFDNLVFFLAYRRTGEILSSQILGRAFAVAFNYTMVRSSVFYSKERHRAVLPKYLLLVLASGTVSYGGIRLLGDRFGVNAVAAKLAVETLLFFANFAVQRLLIFKPREAGHPPEAAAPFPDRLPHTVFLLALAALAGVEIYGFGTARLFQQELWYPVGLLRFTRYIGMYLAVAAPLLLLVPWTFTGLLAALMLVFTSLSVGPSAVLGAAFFLLSACALGSRLLRAKPDSLEDHLLATLAGAGVYIFLMTLLARLAVNYPWFWGLLLAVPLALDFSNTWRRLTYWLSLIRDAELRVPWARAAFALFGFFLLAHWLMALKPEAGSDALAMHLAVPMNIAANHMMTYQPAQFLWSVMPMGADWCYSVAYLFGGEYAARLLNFAMFLIVVGLLYGAARRWLTPAGAWLLAAAFAATPLVQDVTGTLFVENFVAAMILGVMAGIWRFGETRERRYLYLAAALAGTAVATKVGSFAFLAFALPFAIAEIVRHWKELGRRPWAVCAGALLILVAAGAPTYVIAWQKTGNPIFPFWNQTFHSPLLSPHVDFGDERFHHPLGARTLFDLTFHTARFYEGQNGSFGFQYLIVVPLALAGLLLGRKRALAASAWIMAFGAGLLILYTQPNARYLYAALPLALVAFAAAFGWLQSAHRRTYQAVAGCLVACTALNAYFISSASYYHKDFYLRSPFSNKAREQYLRRCSPIREVIAYYDRHHPHSTVLLASDNAIAGIEGEVYENAWHQYDTLEQLGRAFSPHDALQLIKRWHVAYVISKKPKAGNPVRPASLEKVIAICGVPEFEFGDQYLARFRPDCDITAPPVTFGRPTIALPPGFYDDSDPAIAYLGEWSHDESFSQADRQSVSYTDIRGAEASIAFDGKALTYVFTKAPNRGIAEVTIDGVPKGTIDLYSPEIEWQTRVRFCCFGAGRHLAVVRVTGQAAPKARGTFVDLDSFIVE